MNDMARRDIDNGDITGMNGLGTAIKLAIAQHQLVDRLKPHQAVALWSEAAGDRISAVTEAESVRAGVLFVRAKSSVWANELTFYKSDILLRLNEMLGGDVLKDIRFQAGSGPTRTGRSRRVVKRASPDLESVAAPDGPVFTIDPLVKLAHLADRGRKVREWKKENGWLECARCRALFEPIAKASTLNSRTPKRRKHERDLSEICPICKVMT